MSALPPVEPAPARPRRGPYQGLIPYSEDDADWFFGRDRARDVVLDNLRAYELSVLYGPSGVGKSSLLRAGVVRHVREEGRRRIERGEPAEYAALAFGSWSGDPAADLIAAIGEALAQLSPALGAELPHGSLAAVVEVAAQRLDGELLLILDQFEEYFLYHDAGGPFIAEIARMVARRDVAVSVLFSIREDGLAKLDSLTGRLPGLLEHLVRIGHLDRAAAREAIVRPLERWNSEAAEGDDVEIQPELVEATLDAVQGSSVGGEELDGGAREAIGARDASIQTPYLQLVLTRLWDEERSQGSRRLRLSTLVELRGAQRIVAEHVETAIATLSPAEQAVAAKILRQLVTPSGTKIALTSSDLAETTRTDETPVSAVLERLTREGRILQATGSGRYEIYHDALAQPILRWRREWQVKQDRARQRRRYRTVAVIGAGLLLTVVVVAVLAVLAVRASNDAKRKEADAASVALASAARDNIADPDVALLLSLAALTRKSRPEARDAMVQARQAAAPGAALGIMRGHAATVSAVAFLDRGRAIVSAGGDGRILVFDARTRRRAGRAFSDRGPQYNTLAVSADGRRLAAGAEDGSIVLWDAVTRRRIGRFATRGRHAVFSVAFSRDGRVLASAGDEHRIRFWDVDSRRPAGRPIRVDERFTKRVAFSPDGRILATASVPGTVRLWRVRSRQRVRTFRSAVVDAIAFSPDGRTFALGAAGGIQLRDLRSGSSRRLALATGRHEGIYDVSFSADGARLVGAGPDRAVRVWDVRSGQRVGDAFTGPAKRLTTARFSPDARSIAAAGEDGEVWLFDAATPRTLPHRDAADADIAFDSAGDRIAAAGLDGPIRVWDVRTRKASSPDLTASGRFSAIAFAPRANTLAAAAEDGRVLVFDLASGRIAGPPITGQRDAVSSVAFSPDGRLIASGGYDDDPRIILSDAATHRPRGGALSGHRKSVNAVAFSPDGALLASASSDGTVRLWSVARRREVGRAFTLHTARVRDVAFSPDGRTLASAGSDGVVWLRELDNARPPRALSVGDEPVFSVAFGRDGATLVTGGLAGVALWDVASGRPLGTTLTVGPPGLYFVNAVAVSPDGSTIAAAGDTGSRLWPHVIWSDVHVLTDEICALVGSGLTPNEWDRYAAGISYVRLCDR